jgi:hypothetical protein
VAAQGGAATRYHLKSHINKKLPRTKDRPLKSMKRPPGVKQEKQRPPGVKQETQRPLGVKEEKQRPAKVRVAERRLLDKILEDKVLKISNEAGNSFCYCNAPSSKNLIGNLYYGFLCIRVPISLSRKMGG